MEPSQPTQKKIPANLEQLGFAEAEAWELISIIIALGDELNGKQAETEARSLNNWPVWFEDNGFRFELFKEYALRAEASIVSGLDSGPLLQNQITQIDGESNILALFKLLSTDHPKLLEVFAYQLEQCHSQAADLGKLAAGTSSTGKDIAISAAAGVAVSGLALSCKYGYRWLKRRQALEALHGVARSCVHHDEQAVQRELTAEITYDEGDLLNLDRFLTITEVKRLNLLSKSLTSTEYQAGLTKIAGKTQEECDQFFKNEAMRAVINAFKSEYIENAGISADYGLLREDGFKEIYAVLHKQALNTLKLLYADTKQQYPGLRAKIMDDFENKSQKITQDVETIYTDKIMEIAREKLILVLQSEVQKLARDSVSHLKRITEKRAENIWKHEEAKAEEKLLQTMETDILDQSAVSRRIEEDAVE